MSDDKISTKKIIEGIIVTIIGGILLYFITDYIISKKQVENKDNKIVTEKKVKKDTLLTETEPIKLFNSDYKYFQFNAILKVEDPLNFDIHNPHTVAQYAFYTCKEGKTQSVIDNLGHIEKDKELGKSFLTFISVFGTDLEKYKGKEIWLKFHGYYEGKNDKPSVWYYYLADRFGKLIEKKSWISLHRSKFSGECALTGIFINTIDDTYSDMPTNLKTTN